MHFQFPDVLKYIILEYAAEYQLLPWIDESKIHWDWLSRNPSIFERVSKSDIRKLL